MGTKDGVGNNADVTRQRMPSNKDKLTFEPREFKGSRLRCLQLTSLRGESVTDFLNGLCEPHAHVSTDALWMPRGMLVPNEVKLGRTAEFLSDQRRTQLIEWWLSVDLETARIPNWDIVSECAVGGRPGLVLVEAKAHPAELGEGDSSGAVGENRRSIDDAIAEAQRELSLLMPGWALGAHSHYQLSNRFAWAWKIASMGIPVVLVYLGFLNAMEMLTDSRQIFTTAEDWENRVRGYSTGVVPPAMWNAGLTVKGTPLFALIRAAEVTVQAQVR